MASSMGHLVVQWLENMDLWGRQETRATRQGAPGTLASGVEQALWLCLSRCRVAHGCRWQGQAGAEVWVNHGEG